MKHFILLGVALSLESIAAASPVKLGVTWANETGPINTLDGLSGTNAGSIYSFADAASARDIFYRVGSCGLSTYFSGVVPSWMPLVAMPYSVMQYYGASQHNTLCGKTITMTSPNGVTRQAAIADTNVSDDHSIDMTIDLWVAFGQNPSDGSIIRYLTWSIDNGSQPPSLPSPGSCPQTYTVVSGDSCWVIWNRFSISEGQLRAWNPSLDSACSLSIGQVLCVAQPSSTPTPPPSSPTGGPSGSCTKSYTVISGDSCWVIWNRFGISEGQLRAWNPSLDSACSLSIGQVLCVVK